MNEQEIEEALGKKKISPHFWRHLISSSITLALAVCAEVAITHLTLRHNALGLIKSTLVFTNESLPIIRWQDGSEQLAWPMENYLPAMTNRMVLGFSSDRRVYWKVVWP